MTLEVTWTIWLREGGRGVGQSVPRTTPMVIQVQDSDTEQVITVPGLTREQLDRAMKKLERQFSKR